MAKLSSIGQYNSQMGRGRSLSQSKVITIIPALASFVTIAIGCLVLMGWQFDIDWLKYGFAAKEVSMQANTAVGFILAGISLGIIWKEEGRRTEEGRGQRAEGRRTEEGTLHEARGTRKEESRRNEEGSREEGRGQEFAHSSGSSHTPHPNPTPPSPHPRVTFLSQICAIAVFLIGFLTLCQYIFGWNLGIDELLYRDSLPVSSQNAYPGRMGENTALNFCLLGLGLWLHHRQKLASKDRSVQWLTVIAGAIAILILAGHLYGVETFHRFLVYSTSTAWHAAVTFIVLCIGILFVHPDRGLMKPLMGNFMGSQIARQLLPNAIFIPTVLGWLILQGQKLGIYDSALSFALLVVALIIIYCVLIWRSAKVLNRIDRQRQQTEADLQQSQERLRLFAESDLIGLLFGDVYGGIHRVNNAFLKIVGYTRKDVEEGRLRWDAITPSEYRSLDEERIAEARVRGMCTPYEKEYIRKDGRRVWVLVGYILLGAEREESIAFILDISDRKQAQIALEEKKALLSLALEYSQAGAYDWILSEERVIWSPEYYNLFGIDSSCPSSYQTWLERVHPGDRDRVEREIAHGLSQKTDLDVMYRILHPQGERWINGRGKASYNEAGEAVRLVGLCIDISDRKQAEEERDRFFNLSVDMLSIADENGYFKRLNPAWEDILGYRTRELMSKPFIEFVHPDDRDLTLSEIQKLFTGGTTLQFENRYRCKDGSYKWLVWSTVSVPEARLFYGVAHDITKRQQLEATLREQAEALRINQERLDLIIEAANVGLWYNTLPLDKLIWNDQCKEHFGLPPDAEIDINLFYQLLHPDDREPTKQAVAYAIENDRIFDVDYRTIAPDGRMRWIQAIGKPYYDETGKPIRFDGITIDVSDRKCIEAEMREFNTVLEGRVKQRTAQLEAANQELESFSYSVSHDLRAPLRHIAGFVELLQKQLMKTQLDPTSRRYLDIIVETTQQAGQLIDDLLTFSRMGRTEMRQVAIDMNLLVQEVIGDLKLETYNREINLHIAQLPTVQADPSMVRLVWQNLLENALKYTKLSPQTEISVGSYSTLQEMIFFVKDNGIGFDMQYVHKLFGVFQRLHSDPRFEGTGVGLANVQRIVHRHGGRVWAEGAIEQGATFYFALPKEIEVESGER